MSIFATALLIVATAHAGPDLLTPGLHMADDLGLETVAEGIETEQHFDHLRDFGRTHGHGFLMARPGPRFDLEALLETELVW